MECLGGDVNRMEWGTGVRIVMDEVGMDSMGL